MTKTSPSILAVLFLLLSLCSTQRIGAVPVEPDVTEEERQGENEVGQRYADKTIDQIILDAYGGLEAEKAAEDYRMMVGGVETEGMDTLLTPGQSAILHNSYHSESVMFKRWRPFFFTLWTDGVVPYDLCGLPAQYHGMMMEAFRDWERNTCVRFVPVRPEHRNGIVFNTSNGCSSYLGMKRQSQQTINLGNGCHRKKIYLHELGHTLGLIHEHQLPQRDRYIYVDLDNVIPRFRSLFHIYPPGRIPRAQQVTYNLRSIMHFGKYAFSKGNGLQTIYARDKSQEDLMGTSEELASSDIEAMNLLYKCNVDNSCTDNGPRCKAYLRYGHCWRLPFSISKAICRKTCGFC